MPDQIEVHEELGIIEVHSYGIVSKDDIQNSIGFIKNISTEKNIKKILVNTLDQEKMPSTTEIYEIFSQFPREFRLAIIAVKSQLTAPDIDFAETIGINRGVEIRIFNEKESAMNWLSR